MHGGSLAMENLITFFWAVNDTKSSSATRILLRKAALKFARHTLDGIMAGPWKNTNWSQSQDVGLLQSWGQSSLESHVHPTQWATIKITWTSCMIRLKFGLLDGFLTFLCKIAHTVGDLHLCQRTAAIKSPGKTNWSASWHSHVSD